MGRTTFSGPVKSVAGFIIGDGSTITKTLKATATLDFAAIAAAGSANLTIPVVGAAVGDTVSLALPASINAGLVFNAFVSAAGVVTVRATNVTAASIDPAPASYSVIVVA